MQASRRRNHDKIAAKKDLSLAKACKVVTAMEATEKDTLQGCTITKEKCTKLEERK